LDTGIGLHTLPLLVAKAPEQGPKPREVRPTQRVPLGFGSAFTARLSSINPKGEDMIKALLSKFWNEEDGAAAIEYGLLAALIAVTVAGGINLVGDELVTTFGKVVTALKL